MHEKHGPIPSLRRIGNRCDRAVVVMMLGVDLEIKCSGSLRSLCCRAVRLAHDVKLYEQSLPPGQGLVLGLSCLGTGLKVPCTKAKGALELRSWGLGALLLWLGLLCSLLSDSFMGLRGRQLSMALVTK